MLLMTPEEAQVFSLLDPATARRLIVGRTGRAFVWDPINSTTEVSFKAAQSLVAGGIVGANGRIAAEHVELWGQLGGAPIALRKSPAKAVEKKAPRVERIAPAAAVRAAFEQTMPLPMPADSLRTM